jgi:hypothetical protein
LENVRCFTEKRVLDLSHGDGIPAQWTLILGNNGVGKTTLLQCLAWMRPVPSLDKAGTETGITPALADEENIVLENLLRNYPKEESVIHAKLTQGVLLTDLNLESINKTDEIYTKDTFSGEKNGELKNTKPEGTQGEIEPEKTTTEKPNDDEKKDVKYELPLVIAYSANRLQAESDLDKNYDANDPAKTLTETTALIDVAILLAAMDHAARIKSDDDDAKKRFENVKQLLVEILPDLIGDDPIQIYPLKLPGSDNGPYGVNFNTSYGLVPISALSLGYRTTMGWTVDLAWRLYKKYPNSKTPLSEPAIVLIDEIDLHLHPIWQRKIINNLSTHFPNTQFIATAHSPLMVQSAQNANLVVLTQEGDHVQIQNSPEFVEGWRVDQILTSDLFGLPSARSEKVEMMIKERQELLQMQRTFEQEERLKKLEQEIKELPTLEAIKDQDALDFIRRAAEAWKAKGA